MSLDDMTNKIVDRLIDIKKYVNKKYEEQGGCKYCNNTCPWFMACNELNMLLGRTYGQGFYTEKELKEKAYEKVLENNET